MYPKPLGLKVSGILLISAFVLLVTSFLMWNIGRPQAKLRVESQASAIAEVSSRDEKIATLESENVSLKAQLQEANNRNLRLALADLVRQTAQTSQGVPASESDSLKETFARMQRRIEMKSGGFLGGLDEQIELLTMFARLGDDGVRFLLSVAKDKSTYSDKERESALQMLALLPHRDALAYFVQNGLDGSRVSAEAPWRQTNGLSTSDVSPFVPALYQQAQDALKGGQGSNGAKLLASLAFLHGDSRSLQFLQDRQFWNAPEFNEVIQAADDLHTDQARAFLSAAAQFHPNPDTRNLINNMLATWEGKPEETPSQ